MSNTPKLGIPTPISKHGFVHPLVKSTAIELARALYDKMASGSNEWYDKNHDTERWVGFMWKNLLPAARKQLAACLRSPNLDEKQKNEIADALIKDNELRVGRMRGLRRRLMTGS